MNGRIRTVDPRVLVIPEIRVNAVIPDDVREDFARSIRELGIEEPPLVYDTGEQLVVIDGRHRVEQAIASGKDRIQVFVRVGTLQDAVLANLKTNQLRGRPDPVDLVNVIKFLVDEELLTSDDIARRTGMSRDYIERLQWVGSTSAQVLAAFKEGRIGVGAAYVLARIEDEAVRLRLLDQCLAFGWSVKQLEEYRDEAAKIAQEPEVLPAPVAQQLPQLLTCEVCRQDHAPDQVVHKPICRECVGALADARRQRAEAAS